MTVLERRALPILQRVDAETVHRLALAAAKIHLLPRPGPISSTRLRTHVAGLDLPNPVGLAAGIDKSATAVAPLLQTGIGFLEAGAVTPLPQTGNPKPRLFRLVPDRALINRMGFNNDGARKAATRLSRRPKSGILGLNLGANRSSRDPADDFAKVLEMCGPFVDFATINVSSPNSAGIRDLQRPAALGHAIARVSEVRRSLPRPIPVFVKVSPDLDDAAIATISDIVLDTDVAGVIATNTTTNRSDVSDPLARKAGGLSGRPLFPRSTRVLAQFHSCLGNRRPLIGVGGIATAGDAYAKIRAGASAVQLYSALAFQGFSLIGSIVSGLDGLLKRDGFSNVSEAVGADSI